MQSGLLSCNEAVQVRLAPSNSPANALSRAEDIPLQRRIVAFIFLMCADFFYGWSWNTVDVLRPYIRDSLHLTLTQAGSMYSAQSAGMLAGAVVIGQLADRFGRRNMLALVMAGYGMALISGTAVGSYPQVLAQRFVLGLFIGGIFPIVVGIYVSLFDQGIRGRLAALYNGTFNGSAVVLGLAMGAVADHHWQLLLWYGGLPPLLLAGLAFVVVPDDRRIIPFGQAADAVMAKVSKLPITELFHAEHRRITLLLALMFGLNFFGSQAFVGWVTSYLRDVRGFGDTAIGSMVAWQFTASIVGGFFWGWFADRFGRRKNALGFILGSAAIVAYLNMPTDPWLIKLAGAAYGFMIACSVTWGPWIAELYPPHLRSTAASIFNWGRVISFFAPLITAAVAERFSLTIAMSLGAAAFSSAALIWWILPETLRTRTTRG